MKLSMWIIVDWLKDYKLETAIKHGARTMCGVRLSEKPPHDNRYLFIARSDDTDTAMHGTVHADSDVDVQQPSRPSGDVMQKVICTNGDDRITLWASNIDRVVDDILEAFNFYDAWAAGLRESLWSIGSEQELVDGCGNILPNQMIVISDTSHYVHASSSKIEPEAAFIQEDTSEGRALDIDSIITIEQDLRIRSDVRHSYMMSEPSMHVTGAVRNLFSDSRLRGWLVVINPAAEKTQGELDIQDELGDIVEQWMKLHPENVSEWSQEGVFASILDGTYVNKDDVQLRLKLFGWEIDDPKHVYVIRQQSATPADDILVEKINRSSHGCRCLDYHDEVVVVLNDSIAAVETFDRRLFKLLDTTGCTCGRSPGFTDTFQMKMHLDFAIAALRFSSGEQRICCFSDTALAYALSFIPSERKRWIIHPSLPTLIRYDEKNKTEMTHTLNVYLNHDRNYAHTSEVLHIHRSSLLYRVDRIVELTGLDLDDADTRLHLLVSFALLRDKAIVKPISRSVNQ